MSGRPPVTPLISLKRATPRSISSRLGLITVIAMSILPIDLPKSTPRRAGYGTSLAGGENLVHDDGRAAAGLGLAQQHEHRNGGEGDDHHQLVVVDIGEHRRLARDFLIERGEAGGAVDVPEMPD